MLFMQHVKVKRVQDLGVPWPSGIILKDCSHCGGDVMVMIDETDQYTKCLMCSRTHYIGTLNEATT